MYEIARLVHATTATLFVGGMAADMVAHWLAKRDFDPAGSRALFAKFLFADTRITPVLVSLIALSGVIMAWELGWVSLQLPWLVASVLLFGLSGLLFGARLMPLQTQLAELTGPWRTRPPTEAELARYEMLDLSWSRTATRLTVVTFAILLLMLWRPQ